MNIRKGYSDSRLNKLMRSEDDENLNNFLPEFLVKDIYSKEASDSEDNLCIQTTEEDSTICNSTIPNKQVTEKEQYRPIKSRFNSSGDVRQFAKDYKSQLYNQFQNTISRNMTSAFAKRQENNFSNFGQGQLDQFHFFQGANDSNLSIIEDFNNLNFAPVRPQPKRTNSSGNLECKSKGSTKAKNSLFISDKDDRCEDFDDIQHLLNSINCELWVYSRTQKGSRNLQKLLNKIQPDDLDIILEKIKNNFYDLMIDIYGNYFCQKLIQCCSAEQRMFILRHVRYLFTLR
jgi:hypothetical protein